MHYLEHVSASTGCLSINVHVFIPVKPLDDEVVVQVAKGDDSGVAPDQRLSVGCDFRSRARALLDEAGVDRVSFEMMVANSPEGVRTGEVIQALVSEAGFDITLRATEFATALDLQEQGQYFAFPVGWSGRIDPDGNIHAFHTCEGSLNESGFCDPQVDELLNAARAAGSFDERFDLYRQALERYLPDRHIIYLYHTVLFFPHRTNVEGFQAYPDGLIRLQGVTLAQR